MHYFSCFTSFQLRRSSKFWLFKNVVKQYEEVFPLLRTLPRSEHNLAPKSMQYYNTKFIFLEAVGLKSNEEVIWCMLCFVLNSILIPCKCWFKSLLCVMQIYSTKKWNASNFGNKNGLPFSEPFAHYSLEDVSTSVHH